MTQLELNVSENPKDGQAKWHRNQMLSDERLRTQVLQSVQDLVEESC